MENKPKARYPLLSRFWLNSPKILAIIYLCFGVAIAVSSISVFILGIIKLISLLKSLANSELHDFLKVFDYFLASFAIFLMSFQLIQKFLQVFYADTYGICINIFGKYKMEKVFLVMLVSIAFVAYVVFFLQLKSNYIELALLGVGVAIAIFAITYFLKKIQ